MVLTDIKFLVLLKGNKQKRIVHLTLENFQPKHRTLYKLILKDLNLLNRSIRLRLHIALQNTFLNVQLILLEVPLLAGISTFSAHDAFVADDSFVLLTSV